jgi:ribosomal protein S18 acetylase RimI-like enzyme
MVKADLADVKSIVDANQMFPSEFLDEMTVEFFSGESMEKWFVIEKDDKKVIGVAFCSPERMTEGTWNLLMIAVHPDAQGRGAGKQLISYAEKLVRSLDARILLVETSGLPEYQRTRDFYPKCGYSQVALIPEYYDKGDDKIIFMKSL